MTRKGKTNHDILIMALLPRDHAPCGTEMEPYEGNMFLCVFRGSFEQLIYFRSGEPLATEIL